jgi:hypothetical protein
MTDRAGLRSGDLFEWAVVVTGVRVELLAEVAIDTGTLHLRDVAVYAVGSERATVGIRPLVVAARRELLPRLRAAGFTRLRITGVRLTGARPGRIVDLTIDLEKQDR